ncbi:MAG: riboflavin synthase [Solirubrobacteraceae bacterium]|jgi:riboflavin synthase
MFTGIVGGLGQVAAVQRSGDGVRLTVATALSQELQEGDSIAVNGVCLTATAIDDESFAAEVMNETLARSSLADAGTGSEVNLELPVRAADRLGGHLVQGHVDDLGTVVAVAPDGFARRLAIEAPAQLLRYVVQKGSIAVDGVSLTVASIDERSFTVSLIPETLQRTNLGAAQAGTKVNLEVDVLAKYVEKLIGGGA